jgi:hypothetical protein
MPSVAIASARRCSASSPSSEPWGASWCVARWAAGAWAACSRRSTPRSIGPWRSSCCTHSAPTSASGCCTRRGSSPRSRTPTWCTCTRRVRWTGACSSRWSGCTGRRCGSGRPRGRRGVSASMPMFRPGRGLWPLMPWGWSTATSSPTTACATTKVVYACSTSVSLAPPSKTTKVSWSEARGATWRPSSSPIRPSTRAAISLRSVWPCPRRCTGSIPSPAMQSEAYRRRPCPPSACLAGSTARCSGG